MRLYDTLTRSHVELPPPPGPIRHVRLRFDRLPACPRRQLASVRARHVAARLAARERATTSRSSHNITDVDDKVYAEAARQGIGSRELSERATAWFFEDTDDLGLGRPDVEPRATETIPEIVAFIEELDRAGPRVRGERRRLLQRRALPRVRPALRREARRDGLAGVERRSSAISATSRSGSRRSRTRMRPGTRRGGPVGRAGTSSARRWRRSISGRSSRSTAEGSTSASRTTRTSSRSRALSGIAFAHVWMHNGMLELDAEKMSKSLGNVVTLRNVLDTWGREALLVFHLTGPLEQAGRLLRRGDGCRPRRARRASARCSAARAQPAPR